MWGAATPGAGAGTLFQTGHSRLSLLGSACVVPRAALWVCLDLGGIGGAWSPGSIWYSENILVVIPANSSL